MMLLPRDTLFFINSWTWGYEDILKAIARFFNSQVSRLSGRSAHQLTTGDRRYTSIAISSACITTYPIPFSSELLPRTQQALVSTHANDSTDASTSVYRVTVSSRLLHRRTPHLLSPSPEGTSSTSIQSQWALQNGSFTCRKQERRLYLATSLII